MREKNQLTARIKRLRAEVHRLENRVVVLKAMIQAGEKHVPNGLKIKEGCDVPLIVGD